MRAEAQELKGLKSDLNLFTRLLIVSQSRELNFFISFSYENQLFPPSLSKDGDLYLGTKSDILTILEKLIDAPPGPVRCDGVVYDGAALVHVLRPRLAKKFGDYWPLDLKPSISRDARNLGAERVDFVFDNYDALSLKRTTREQRGSRVRRRVLPQNDMPRNWQDFMRNPSNKKDLFQLLAYTTLSDKDIAAVVTNIAETIVASSSVKSALAGVSCVKQEEADGRMYLHVSDMLLTGGLRRVKLRTVDSDVVVIGISYYHKLRGSGLAELWVDFGLGKQHRYIAAHLIAIELGEEKATALRGFHAISGCDTCISNRWEGEEVSLGLLDSYARGHCSATGDIDAVQRNFHTHDGHFSEVCGACLSGRYLCNH